MATVLNEESTHEDIQEAVDKIIEDRQGEQLVLGEGEKDTASGDLGTTKGLGPKKDPEKGDAQKIAEDHDKPTIQKDTPAVEDESGSEETADTGEETGEWLTDDLKAEVAAYGIDEKELADFTSREEVERALRFFDKSALEAGRKAQEQSTKEETSSRDEKGRFVKQPKEEPKEDMPTDGLTDLWDDEAKEELNREFANLRNHYESRIAAIESRFEELEAEAEERQFDSAVDSLGHADLLGKSGRENSKQLERRQALFQEVKFRLAGMETFGHRPNLNESFVGRVARMVFAEELSKKELKAQTRKLSKQANNRGGDTATKGDAPEETLLDEMRRKWKEMGGDSY
jgi:hypothetical protein